jgi:hypothetical protein
MQFPLSFSSDFSSGLFTANERVAWICQRMSSTRSVLCFLALTCFIDDKCSSKKQTAIDGLNGFLCLLWILNDHKAKATASAGFTISHDVGLLDNCMLGEQIHSLLIGRAIA